MQNMFRVLMKDRRKINKRSCAVLGNCGELGPYRQATRRAIGVERQSRRIEEEGKRRTQQMQENASSGWRIYLKKMVQRKATAVEESKQPKKCVR